MITIVIPVYNRASLVERTLSSVAAQTYRPLKLILVDNASTDDTRRVLDRWAEDHRADDFDITVISENTPGAAAARATGLRHVDTEWTMYFDSDDVMRPDHVRRAMETAATHPKADIIGWDVMLHIPGMKERRLVFSKSHHIFNAIMHGTMATQRYMARTSLFRNAGNWNSDVRIWNDIEIGLRLLRLSPVIVHAGRTITVDVYFTPTSITGHNFSHNHEKIEESLTIMACNIDPSVRVTLALKRAIMAGRYEVEGKSNLAREMYSKARGECESAYTRALIYLAYHYTGKGMRGAARIFRPLILLSKS